jgi:hypothetical protein
MVLWNYVLQFGRDQARAMVFVGQSARDLETPKFNLALMTHDDLHQWMPMIEEPAKFNDTIEAFGRRVFAAPQG